MNIKEIIEQLKKSHEGYGYEYIVDETITSKSQKIKIICPKHGEFEQRIECHLKGQKCPKCSKEESSKKLSLTYYKFVERSKQIHGDKYVYLNERDSNYTNAHSKVKIICPKHGEFEQIALDHMKGIGCYKCGKKISDTVTFIERAEKFHGDKYDYSKVEYKTCRDKVKIICPIHGEFEQIASYHLNGNGCPKCGIENTTRKKKMDLETFIKKATQIHNGKYDYSKVKEIIHSRAKVEIICKTHGVFKQEVESHLRGCGCPACINTVSKDEYEIYNHISGKIHTLKSVRGLLSNKKYEIDIYIPSRNIGIEYNGILWHSMKFKEDKNYHLNKLNMCNEQGINLIQIFEDEYKEHKELVQNKILHLLGLHQNLPRIMGRKCEVREIDMNTAKQFLNVYHIQCFASSSVYLGAFYNEKIVGVMSFKQEKKNSHEWELTRFATDYNYICQGIGGKLFKYFNEKFNPTNIKSFADRRWTLNENNNLYTKLGFTLEKILKPDYKYVVNDKRKHKFNFRKQTLHKQYDFPLTMTESEMTEKLGIYRIYDCGLYKYVWKKE